MPDNLTKRHGVWQFVRRVPGEYAAFDKRPDVKHSTKVKVRTDKRGIKAGKIAEALNHELQAYWRALSEGKAQEAQEAQDRYNNIKRAAPRISGFDHAETAELASRSTLERLEKLMTALLVELKTPKK
jgi:hypothetical protein